MSILDRSRPVPLTSRFGRYFADTGWIHLTLLTGVAVFLFPFLWMLSTSLKTDEELPLTRVLPSIPTFRGASPFVRPGDPAEKPEDVRQDQWDTTVPALLDAARAAIRRLQESAADAPWRAQNVDAVAHREAAANLLVGALTAKMKSTLWQQPQEAILAEFRRLLDAGEGADTAAALSDSLGRMELLDVQIRTQEGHILTAGREFQGAWTIESGPGQIVEIAGTRRLEYRFASGSDRPVALHYEMKIPADLGPNDFHKVTVTVKADDSWHRFDAVLRWGDRQWHSTQTTYAAQHRELSLGFQPPGFDDTTNRIRTWVPIEPEARRLAPALAPGQAELLLTLSPSSTLRATCGKIERNYQRAFLSVPFWKYLWNSITLVALTVIGSLFSASFVAYAFARLRWPGRSVAFLLLLCTMMLPGQVTMIPGFMVWRTLGWYNTLNPMWVPAWFGGAFFIFLMTQQMRTIPRELEEAAMLDGLNAVQTWWYVILPLVKPTMAAIAIMAFMGAWNEFMGPLIYLRDQDLFPLSLGLFGMRADQGGDWTMLMAGNMLMTLPVILCFFIFQRYFIQGMTMSGLKG
jgi:ABC-type glycerol-3-phosphate transport system permease component